MSQTALKFLVQMMFLIILHSILQKIRFLLKPSPAWGPAHKVPTFKMEEDDDEDDGVVSNPNFTITNIREISA